MKQITLTQEQFKKAAAKAMRKYTDKMKKEDKSGIEYDSLSEMSDVLTMSICFALLECDLFYKEGECDEQRQGEN